MTVRSHMYNLYHTKLSQSKHERMSLSVKNQRQRGAVRPPPAEFWKMWKSQMHNIYPRGIDRAEGIQSTKFDPDRGVPLYDQNYVDKLRRGDRIRKGDLKMSLLKSPEEALVYHRVEKIVKNEQKKVDVFKAQHGLPITDESSSLLRGNAAFQQSMSTVGSSSSDRDRDPFKQMNLATKATFANMFAVQRNGSTATDKTGNGRSSGKSLSRSQSLAQAQGQGGRGSLKPPSIIPRNGKARISSITSIDSGSGSGSATSSVSVGGGSHVGGRSRVSFA
jgi:hypothetical protein